MKLISSDYNIWKQNIVDDIRQSKLKTMLNVNSALLQNYWQIGKQILEVQKEKGWGAQVIDMLSKDLKQEFPDATGYSSRNLKYMRTFAEVYPHFPFMQVPLAQLKKKDENLRYKLLELNQENGFVQVPLAQLSWYHHISLLTKVKDIKERAFYILETAENGWSRDIMLMQVENDLYHRKGMSINNFKNTLQPVQSDLANQIFKDPYTFDFINLTDKYNEVDIERQLTTKITDFLVEMGRGFAFVGRQYNINVEGDDYFIDLLMYHLKLHCYVVIELKAVEFKPEFVSKLNFYISAVDDKIKTPQDNPTIGLLLCRTKNNVKAEYSLRGMSQPLGIAEYETQKIFEQIKSSLPSIEELESQLEN